MSTSTAPALPAWVDKLRSTVTANLKENKDLISYALATHDTATPHSDAPVPRVRYVVHRGFVNERRKEGDGSSNEVKDKDGNDLISDKLVITTDARSPKARQLAATPTVEIAWWLAATQHQFRLLGRAYVLPSPSFSSPSSSAPSFPFPAEALAPTPSFNWEAERVRQFRKLSPELRASFCRPVPGSSVREWGGRLEDLPVTLPEGVDEAEGDEQKKQVEQALENFALVVIDCTEVDLVDLGSQPNTRTRWTFDTASNEWKEEELVP
ncbi:pyridoxamine 5'-phosphate oxidase-domain-containing protein [Rhodotorula diobovata]|uniref:Pyridoxamine 5'-phosphate oxidase-domain-containing protein n=1 Tax=Rhodotorula diobovata TaxID=5288 RepID=A0A5C5G0Z2_9BASI|nr:pyridoxamine 5'-phosphate oxidase-domain-containing protein [Rhodotorula diobovata]